MFLTTFMTSLRDFRRWRWRRLLFWQFWRLLFCRLAKHSLGFSDLDHEQWIELHHLLTPYDNDKWTVINKFAAVLLIQVIQGRYLKQIAFWNLHTMKKVYSYNFITQLNTVFLMYAHLYTNSPIFFYPIRIACVPEFQYEIKWKHRLPIRLVVPLQHSLQTKIASPSISFQSILVVETFSSSMNKKVFRIQS